MADLALLAQCLQVQGGKITSVTVGAPTAVQSWVQFWAHQVRSGGNDRLPWQGAGMAFPLTVGREQNGEARDRWSWDEDICWH